MDIDPMEMVEQDNDKSKHRLNSWVAIMVAVLATFIGICKVKDDNIVQQMQQDQAKSVDAWAWYQAKKTRLQFAEATADSLELQSLSAPVNLKPAFEKKIGCAQGRRRQGPIDRRC